jgi:hypothetical protein
MNTQNKPLVWIGVGLVIVVIIAVAAIFIIRGRSDGDRSGSNQNSQDQQQVSQETGQNNQESGGTGGSFDRQYASTCDKNAKPVFTKAFMPLEQIGGIEPLGKTSDGHVTPVDHVYIAPMDANVADNTYDVIMPADGRVVDVGRMPAQYVGDRSDVQLAQDDFRVVISFSCRYYAILIHVHKLSDPVAKAVGTIAPNETKRISLELKAGDLIAKLGGSPFDLTMIDTQTILPGFITPKLYESESWKIHTIDPFSIYSGELKAALEAKSLRTTAPFGGKFDWDTKGALIGNWFKQGTKGYQGANPERYWDGHLSIAPNNIDPTAIIYSAGNWSGKAQQLAVKDDLKPETITVASGVTKFEVMPIVYTNADGSQFSGGVFKRGMKIDRKSGKASGTVLVQVLDGEKLKIEQFPGKEAAAVTGFTANAMTYER